MANLDTIYNPDERTKAFENHATGWLISLAGPGTGKTFSLLKRSAALNAKGVDQNSICYLTFIKEISNAFIQDYIETFGKESYELQPPRISTLHSFACRLLRHQGYRIRYDGELYFANTADNHSDVSTTLLSDLFPFVSSADCKTHAQLRSKLETIKTAWRNTLDPSTLDAPIPNILQAAKNLFRAFRVFDWDQTIPEAHSLAQSLPTLPSWISEIKHYFIDEYQDFNKAEQSLIAFLANYATSVVVVGDDDQSLYSGRGGSPDGLRNLYMNTVLDQVSLVKCYRCRLSILNSANTFQRSMHPNPRLMLPTKDNGQIFAFRFKSSKTELEFLITYLRECITQMPTISGSKDGTVCLFPNRRVLDSYFDRLSPHIPCIKKRIDVLPNRLWLERILHLICTPNQRFLERLLLNEFNQVKPRHKQSIIQRIVERDISVVSAVQSLRAEGVFSGPVLSQLREFCQLIDDVSSRDVDIIAPCISSKLSKDCAIIKVHLAELIRKLDEPDKEDIVSLFCDLIFPESAIPTENNQSILFLTMHGSKGLTKKNVVLPGLEAAWLPGTSQGAELDEKRRLFYVAITRATDRMLITFPHNRGLKDSLNFPTPGRGDVSPFIVEAGLHAVYHN